jgi:hypothetical protein
VKALGVAHRWHLGKSHQETYDCHVIEACKAKRTRLFSSDWATRVGLALQTTIETFWIMRFVEESNGEVQKAVLSSVKLCRA